MSQKTHPTSLRLQKTNKYFTACWYSDFFSSQKNVCDLQIRAYLDSISEQIGHIQMSFYILHQYRRLSLYSFFLDARGVRNAREKSLRLPHKTNRNKYSSYTSASFLSAYALRSKSVSSCADKNALKQSFCKLLKLFVLHKQSLSVNKEKSPALHKQMQCIANASDASAELLQVEKVLSKEILFKNIPGLCKSIDFEKVFQSVLNSTLKTKKDFTISCIPKSALHLCRSPIRVQEKKSCDASINSANTSLAFASANAPLRECNATLAFAEAMHLLPQMRASQCIADAFASKALMRRLASFCWHPKQLSPFHGNFAQTYANKYIPETLFHGTIERLFNCYFLDVLSMYPIRVVEDAQIASFLGKEISYLLQRGASFQQIKDEILREYMRNPSIKGIRLSCSGRVGGRSKKAQKAKTQSIQWGQTSLHVFSSKLSFAHTHVNLSFGKIGIKVWLCYIE